MINGTRDKRKKAWIITAASFLLVVGCAGVVWVDWKKIGEERTAAEGLRGKIAVADGRIRKIPDIEGRVLLERSAVREYVKILPDDKDINTFVSKITDFAGASGVEISSLDDKSARDRSRTKSAEAFVKIVYRMSLRGTFEQFLDFVNRFETFDRFVSVNLFDMKADKTMKPEEGAVTRHAIDVELETYVYNAKGSGAPQVDILNGDQKLAKLMRGDATTDPLVLDRYEWVSRPGRRDPLVDPRRSDSATPVVADGQGVESQKAALAELVSAFAELQQALTEESTIDDVVKRIEFTKRLNGRLLELEEKLRKLEEAKYFSDTTVHGEWQTAVAGPFARIMKERPTSSPGLKVQEVETQLTRMTTAFEQERYHDVLAAALTLSGSLGATEPDAALAEPLAKIEALRVRAAARQEFAQKPMKFSGTVYKQRNPKSAIVIINDRAYSPGDVMDDGVVVRSVNPARVVFLYKQEEIARALE